MLAIRCGKCNHLCMVPTPLTRPQEFCGRCGTEIPLPADAPRELSDKPAEEAAAVIARHDAMAFAYLVVRDYVLPGAVLFAFIQWIRTQNPYVVLAMIGLVTMPFVAVSEALGLRKRSKLLDPPFKSMKEAVQFVCAVLVIAALWVTFN